MKIRKAIFDPSHRFNDIKKIQKVKKKNYFILFIGRPKSKIIFHWMTTITSITSYKWDLDR